MSVFQWPREWSKFVSGRYNLQTASLRSQSTFTPARSASYSFSFWRCDLVYRPLRGPSNWQGVEAWFARLDGDVNVFRMFDPLRCQPRYNRQHPQAPEKWSDDTNWSDGTGWVSGMIPPTAQLAAAASRGARFIHVEGLPEGIAEALAPGDLLELRPNGVATETGNLYQVVVGGATDANGEIGIEIRPPLRQNFAAGDQVVFVNAQTVFRLTDPEQGSIERDANIGHFGFAGVEHLG
jgi:hypothetical protein